MSDVRSIVRVGGYEIPIDEIKGCDLVGRKQIKITTILPFTKDKEYDYIVEYDSKTERDAYFDLLTKKILHTK